MPDITKETVTTSENSEDTTVAQPEKRATTSYQTASYYVYFILGVLEVLLAFRLVLKLLGANPSSGFVDFIYGLSAIFVAPFTGIFNTTTSDGAVVSSVLEPATIVALIVYALLAWGIVTLIRTLSGRQQ